jgi:hypothetical protein
VSDQLHRLSDTPPLRQPRPSATTLKLRGPDGCIDVAAWREHTADADAKIEGDWTGERRLVSASPDGKLDDEARDELLEPKPSVPRLLTDEQRRVAQGLMIPSRRWTCSAPSMP